MKNQQSRNIYRFNNQQLISVSDQITVEEPLEIKIGFGKGKARQQRSLSVTMRTPGDDFNLVRGFLFTEGLIANNSDILSMRYIGNQLDKMAQENVLLVDLNPDLPFDINQLNRHFYTSSSCGVCGKASIEMVRTTSCYLLNKNHPQIVQNIIYHLPERLRAAQTVFDQTGGIHAVGLFNKNGNLLFAAEDVGRHNAMDKLIGKALKEQLLPLSDDIILVSGRTSFELTQKAIMAGVPILAAVGAPSTLAIDLAEENGMTLIGFLNKTRANIYCGVERLRSTN
ncbi:MAG: formate dehydrogenase accessory sulfurtransferase FdhD [Saprospiraceae bacterium]